MKKWDKWITLAPIALVLAFLPLVVGRINSKTYTENEPWLPANAVESDFFLYGKLFVLFFCCLFMIVILARMRFWRQIHEMPKYLLLPILYGGFAIASSQHANHPFLSVRGMTGNMQGLFVQFFLGEKNRKYFHTDKITWCLNWNPWRDWYFAVLWI